jgi:hypothetical protein
MKSAGLLLEEQDAIIFDRVQRRRYSPGYESAGFGFLKLKLYQQSGMLKP